MSLLFCYCFVVVVEWVGGGGFTGLIIVLV